MSLECRDCERDLRGGHDPECSRYKPDATCCVCGKEIQVDLDNYDGAETCDECLGTGKAEAEQ